MLATAINLVADGSNLAGGFSQLWGLVPGGLQRIMLIGGGILAFVCFVGLVWDSRRKGGQNTRKWLLGLAVGALLIAPGGLLPGLLGVIDTIFNIVVNLLTSAVR